MSHFGLQYLKLFSAELFLRKCSHLCLKGWKLRLENLKVIDRLSRTFAVAGDSKWSTVCQALYFYLLFQPSFLRSYACPSSRCLTITHSHYRSLVFAADCCNSRVVCCPGASACRRAWIPSVRNRFSKPREGSLRGCSELKGWRCPHQRELTYL